jgi:hypothetical protein
MGKSWENLGKKEQAVLYYKKAASILGKNGDTGQEKTEQPLDALEV